MTVIVIRNASAAAMPTLPSMLHCHRVEC